jgi:hypothetical protein
MLLKHSCLFFIDQYNTCCWNCGTVSVSDLFYSFRYFGNCRSYRHFSGHWQRNRTQREFLGKLSLPAVSMRLKPQFHKLKGSIQCKRMNVEDFSTVLPFQTLVFSKIRFLTLEWEMAVARIHVLSCHNWSIVWLSHVSQLIPQSGTTAGLTRTDNASLFNCNCSQTRSWERLVERLGFPLVKK